MSLWQKKMKKDLIKIGITMGDAAGIGPEIILKYFQNTNLNNKPFVPVIIGNYKWLSALNKKFKQILYII